MNELISKSMSDDQINVWHEGELAVQKMAGTDERMAEIGPKFIREFMPDQHRAFFQSLSMLFIGYTDYSSNIYSSILFGDPGFIQSPTQTTLIINTQQTMGDFAIGDLSVGDRIGLVGIVFETKRRNRVNAVVTDINQKNIELRILQSYGNCPKYIQPRTFIVNPHYGNFSSSTYKSLSHDDKKLVSNADVFFIASSFNDDRSLNNRGTDNSHRGGERGFITINDDGQLLIDDYFGNGFFNTMGNLFKNPEASLLFCDWNSGHVLQITVTSEVLWADENTTYSPNQQSNQRILRFTPIKVQQIKNGLAHLEINH